jgi:hypothetical protein
VIRSALAAPEAKTALPPDFVTRLNDMTAGLGADMHCVLLCLVTCVVAEQVPFLVQQFTQYHRDDKG